MKKIFYKLFVGIGVVLMLIYYTVTAALCYPFHSLKYRRSTFFQETGIPFSAAKYSVRPVFPFGICRQRI